uniref:(California timema) hypothetical protein n=1 Tax=Timema californicum TaxID=61474 RepID=A0A7R9JEG3_TIMCA|nr:unnamed protein product [Timema californicum]
MRGAPMTLGGLVTFFLLAVWFSSVTGWGRLASNLEPLLGPPSDLLASSGTSGVFLGRPLGRTSMSLLQEEIQPVPVSFNCVKQELSDSQHKQHSGSLLLRHLLGNNMDIEENHSLQPSPLPVLIPDIKAEAQDSKFITTNLLPITKAERIKAEPSTGPSWKPISDDINSNNISIPNDLSEITRLGK